MKLIKFVFFLIFASFIYSEITEIENGQTIEIFFEEETQKELTYNFIVPELDTYEQAIFLYKLNFDNTMSVSVMEDGKKTSSYSYKGFLSYHLSSVQNKTITFTINKIYSSHGTFTLLDLTKEIKTSLDNLINIIPTSFAQFLFDPICKINYVIEEIDSDQTFFIREKQNFYSYTIIGNDLIEYCYDENCLNDIFNSSNIIEFKKGSKYKIRINYIKINGQEVYYYLDLETTKYSNPIKLNKGSLIYDIDQSNLDHYYIIKEEDINNFRFYSNSYTYIKYTETTEELIYKLPSSLEDMQFKAYTLNSEINIKSGKYILIILKDDESSKKNLICLFDTLIENKDYFYTFKIYKGNYSIILSNSGEQEHFFSSIESNKPSLKSMEIDSFEKEEFLSQIINKKIVLAFNKENNIIIKLRYYNFGKKDVYNDIKSINNDKLNYYLNNYGNNESLFLRFSSNNFNYYGFATLLVFDLDSEYYLYLKQFYGDLNIYKYKINDTTNFMDYLGIIKSYEDDSNFTLINNHLTSISGSLLISAFLNYGFFGDLYIQKIDDNENIKLNNNNFNRNLVKLLKSEKMYKLDFNLNHLIKLDNAFSDAIVIFYNENGNEIGFLNKEIKIIELSGNNIKIKSNKNALIYFFSSLNSEKKLYEISFNKEEIGKNMNITITNLNSDNESIILIKDYGFKNYYPLLSPNNWEKIIIEKNKTTSIFIENPYDKLKLEELSENETFIIYIASAYDENGIPYFEGEKFEIKNISYKKNYLSKNNKFNFQVIEFDKESSFILSQSNKNKINYQMTYCNKKSFSYGIIWDYSNSNISSKDKYIYNNQSISYNIENNEIISHTYYIYVSDNFNLLFYYNFYNNNEKKSELLSLSSSYENTIDYIKALDENTLEVKFTT